MSTPTLPLPAPHSVPPKLYIFRCTLDKDFIEYVFWIIEHRGDREFRSRVGQGFLHVNFVPDLLIDFPLLQLIDNETNQPLVLP